MLYKKIKDHCEDNLRAKPLIFICKYSGALGHCVVLCLPTDPYHVSDHDHNKTQGEMSVKFSQVYSPTRLQWELRG